MASSSINTIRIQGIDGDVEILGHSSTAHFAQNVTDSAVQLTNAGCTLTSSLLSVTVTTSLSLSMIRTAPVPTLAII